MLFDTMTVGSLDTNCYLFGDGEVCALVDPGAGAEKLLEMVRRSGARLETIFLTHGHYDHTGAVADLLAACPGVEVRVHAGDFKPGLDASLFPLYGQVKDGVELYQEGEALSVGNIPVRVLHTPGHSPGSVTLLAEDRMFCGDTLFALNCGRWDLPGGDMYDLIASLAVLGDLKGDFKVCPGHGEDTSLDFERGNNPYMRHALRI